jgi:chromosomal replication initiator protein
LACVYFGFEAALERVDMQDTVEVFSEILERVKGFDPVNTRKWFEDLVVLQFEGGLLEVGCPDEDKAQFLRDHCLTNFTKAAQNVTGHLVSTKFSVAGQKPSQFNEEPSMWSLKLHPDYTFENFVVGPCNRLAQASCVAVCHSPGDTYNPLFLYGNVGLGKTHLQHAICHGVRSRKQDAKIRFLSCEEFVNRFINAIEQGKLSEFQNKFRTVDLLVIDDVQFLREREQSQEEFFHTFNALYNNHRQIVLTADCAPGEIPSLEERLISRFKWGLVARLDAPSYETRVAIVQKKAHLRGFDISEDVATYIAGKVHANIRELEGALTIIYATAKTLGEPINLEMAKRALGDQDILAKKRINISEIINAVTEYYDVRLSDLQSKKRSQSITLPRQICMYLARQMTRHSLEEIGGHLGGRDHTTVLHACGKIKDLSVSDQKMRKLIEELTSSIRQGS